MSMTPSVERDERTEAVENAIYKWAYLFVYFALLIDVGYRTWFRREPPLDLLALVIVSGTACMIYQIRLKIWTRSQTRVALLAGLGGAVFGAVGSIVFRSWFGL